MASSASAFADRPASIASDRKGIFARMAAFLEALDGDHFTVPDARLARLEQRVAELEAAAAPVREG